MNNIWWKAVPNSVKFIREIIETLEEGSSVAAVIPERCEWEYTLRSLIKERLRNGVDPVYEISGSEIGESTAGEYLAERFIKSELRARYRSSVGYETFITRIEKEAGFDQSYLLLHGLNDQQLKEWLSFIDGYNRLHSDSDRRCRFIIETASDTVSGQKRLKVIRRNERLRRFDITILCMMAASSGDLDSTLREYTAELATLCSGEDPEFAAALIDSSGELLRDTGGTVGRIVSESVRSDGAAFVPVPDLDRMIRRAQQKVFFPLIESFRLAILARYEDSIPTGYGIYDNRGEPVESVYDIELSTLKWLCDNQKMHIPRHDYEKLAFFKECRNKIAHLETLRYDELVKIAEETKEL